MCSVVSVASTPELLRHSKEATRRLLYKLRLAETSQVAWRLRFARSTLLWKTLLTTLQVRPLTFLVFLWVATELNILYVVVLTNSSVTNDLFPIGSMGILGLGVNLWRGSAPNASLIASYLPYVILYFFLSLCV